MMVDINIHKLDPYYCHDVKTSTDRNWTHITAILSDIYRHELDLYYCNDVKKFTDRN